jgi:predicted pyridoxine 5'-phosphate oxidase superfamily flavin-nucleotide-binding protein
MAKQFDGISDTHRAFIEAQRMFFTGTAGPEGRVNISPKGMDSLRVLGPNRIVWLNRTGSGNATDDAATKLIYLAIRKFEKTGRCVRGWVAARNQFAILYPERFNR